MESGVTEISSSPSLAAMTCTLGDSAQADGSATLTHGHTSVHAAVYGPREVRISKEILDKATVEVTYKTKSGPRSCLDTYRENHISGVFKASLLVSEHPRSSISIVVQEREDRGALLAASVNAACLALLDANVSMKFMVAAAVAVITKDGNVTLALQEKQNLEDISATVLVTFENVNSRIVAVDTSGKFTWEQYEKCIALCREASKRVFEFYKETMEKKLSKMI